MQILLINGGLYGLIKGLYGTLAKTYDLMLTLVEKTSGYNFDSFAQSLYTIAGVFMLFRVTVGLINMIINPDQVNDKNAGAGKLLTRIVTSIVLLLVFAPTSFVMRSDGLLNRVQEAVIGEDGLVNNFISGSNMSESKKIDITKENTSTSKLLYNNNLLFEDVYAATKSKTCYFAQKVYKNSSTSSSALIRECKAKPICQLGSSEYNKSECEKCQNEAKANVGTEYYKVTFYYADSDVKKGVKISDNSNMTAEAFIGSEGGYNFSDPNFKAGGSPSITEKSVVECENWGIMKYGAQLGRLVHNPDEDSAVYIGYNSLADMDGSVEDDIDDNYEEYVDACLNDPDECDTNIVEKIESRNSWLPGVSNSAIEFITNLASSFQTCNADSSSECEDAKEEQFGLVEGTSAKDGSKKIVDLMDEEDLTLEFVIALIAGILLIVFIIMLCVDVVVRNFKLLLLKMIAPIPIISYVDPKDKIFMNWLKMFFSVYIDLFIKLMAIKIALVLIDQLTDLDLEGIEYFFVIIGILIFAKLIPSMISKIFGLDINGSFKDIGNMIKSGAGLAAGAVIGGAVGAATGKGFGRISGALGGAFRGAGSGSKGKIMGGAQSIAARNNKINQQKEEGLKLMDRMMIGVAGMTGIPLSGKHAEKQIAAVNAAQEQNSNFKKWVEGEAEKKGVVFKTGNTAVQGKSGRVYKSITGGSTTTIANGNQTVDWKRELEITNVLQGMTEAEFQNMKVNDKAHLEELIGAQAAAQDNLTMSKLYQNDRIATLKDTATAEYITQKSGDKELEQQRELVKTKIQEARDIGVDIPNSISVDNINAKTFSNNKDSLIDLQNKITKEKEPALKRSKYVKEQ